MELINCIRRYQNPNEILLALILHEENKHNYYNREETTPSYNQCFKETEGPIIHQNTNAKD
jgi:hypothetical protein